jgi:hypothetical protein
VSTSVGRLQQALYELKTLGARYPRLVVPAARWRGRGVPIGPDTDIVIEGFPRSANTFTVAAFTMSQPRPVRAAHHLHAPGHVIAAVRRGLPALVLVRQPEDAVLEYVIRRPGLGLAQAVRGYVRFYQPLLPYVDGFVVGSFEQVTTDLGAVIRLVNRTFGTSFEEFHHSKDNVKRVFEAIELDYSGAYEAGDEFEVAVARPSPLRDDIKTALRGRYRAEVPAGLRVAAVRLHDSLCRPAGRDHRPGA